MAYIIVSEWTNRRIINSRYPVPAWKTPMQTMNDLHRELEQKKEAGEISGYSTELVKEER